MRTRHSGDHSYGPFAVGTVVSAQPGMGKYQQLYTTGSVATVSGVVQSVYHVTGARVTVGGKTMILAAQVKKGAESVAF
jgi:hypothetical protein